MKVLCLRHSITVIVEPYPKENSQKRDIHSVASVALYPKEKTQKRDRHSVANVTAKQAPSPQ